MGWIAGIISGLILSSIGLLIWKTPLGKQPRHWSPGGVRIFRREDFEGQDLEDPTNEE